MSVDVTIMGGRKFIHFMFSNRRKISTLRVGGNVSDVYVDCVYTCLFSSAVAVGAGNVFMFISRCVASHLRRTPDWGGAARLHVSASTGTVADTSFHRCDGSICELHGGSCHQV